MNLQNRKRFTDLENELMVAGGGGIVRYLGMDMYTLLYLKCIIMEKEMATHSSVLAWRIPGMREPGGLPSMGLHRVGHD